MKTCNTCKKDKPFTAFYKRKGSLDGYRNDCIPCKSAKVRKLQVDKPEKYRMQQKCSKYNISKEQYIECTSQDTCSVCGLNTDLVFDHCHTTTEYRGMLCRECNIGLGMFKDTEEFLLNAVRYLRRFYE